MIIYRAIRQIDHGLDNGKVVKYAPGDEVPEQLAEALPNLVESILIPGAERVPAPDPNKPKTKAIEAKLAEKPQE